MGQLFCLARSLEFVGRIPISIIISTGGAWATTSPGVEPFLFCMACVVIS